MSEFQLLIPEAADPKAPLVVCLGWYGCQPRHLAKYSGLLNDRGFPTVNGILPGWAVFAPLAWPRRRFAARLLDFVAAADPAGARPLCFYIFSNGGAFVLEQVDLLVRQDPRYRQLGGRTAGVVFDSAPCFMAWGVGAAALGHGLAWPLRALAALLFLAVSLLMPHRPAQFWRHMTDLRVGRKSLYLYSHDDPLCSAERVDALVAARRAAGADVAALSWRRSQHVGHLIKNYREYTEALLGFLRGLA